MIKVVIIDDDIEMLIGLRKIIDWEQYGYIVVGEADNGEKGLEIIKEFRPDVVITDITMPAMNGLDLIDKAQKIVPDIKPIILTCHEDFNYAKQALRLKACDYVLKYTLTKEILVEIIQNLREKINCEKNINTKLSAIDEELKNNKNFLKQKILKDLLNFSAIEKDISKIRKEANAFDIKLPEGNYILINIFIDDFEINIKNAKINNELLAYAMKEIFYEVCEGYDKYSYFNYSMDTKFILLWGDIRKDNIINASLNSKLSKYNKYIYEQFNIKTSICISNIYSNVFEISKAFEECKELRNEYFYEGSLSIVKYKNERWNKACNLYSKYKSEWIKELLTDSREKIMNFIIRVSEEIKKSKYSPEAVKSLFNNLIIDIKSMANKNGIEINCNSGFDTMDSCVQSLENVVHAYSKGLQDAFDRNFRIEIKRVLQYIDENLSNHITCDKMAEYIKMNTSYFSRLFKKETGMSFSDYVIKKKIDKATYLLRHSGLPVEEIAFSTGFSNVSYFYKTYKRITGKTPGNVKNI